MIFLTKLKFPFKVLTGKFAESCYKDSILFCCLFAQSCLTLCNPMDCSPPGSSVHGIAQARILEWVPFPSPVIWIRYLQDQGSFFFKFSLFKFTSHNEKTCYVCSATLVM